jgi:hypothetical protein
MKGKKFDTQFLSSFMEKCIKKNISTPAGMVSAAKNKISKIDKKIMEAERLKVIRGKLLDVIEEFGVPVESKVDTKILEFARIQNPNICKWICDIIKDRPCCVSDLIVMQTRYLPEDLSFVIKQLRQHKVITSENNMFVRGEQFDQYMKFVSGDEE